MRAMERTPKSRGGRPRGFDREAAIDVALRLFWRHGYEGVSIADLTAAIGVAAPSLYAAFGSKADLYRAALLRFEERAERLDLSGFDEGCDLSEAAGRLLRSSVRAVVDPAWEPGCMISTGLLACGEAHRALARELAERRAAFRATLARRLRALLPEPEAEATARYLAALTQGIAAQASDGATAAELEGVVAAALRGLSRRGARGAARESASD